jgi:hypothetical protein
MRLGTGPVSPRAADCATRNDAAAWLPLPLAASSVGVAIRPAAPSVLEASRH